MSSRQERADRYATTVWDVVLNRLTSAFSEASKALGKDKKLAELLSDSTKPAADRAAALEKALPKNTPPEVVNLLKAMMEAGDLNLIDDVAQRLVQVSSGKAEALKAEIASAIELTEKEKDQIRQRLVNEHGENLVFSFAVDPALLGGLRVRVGDHLVDNSVASRLAVLRESLSSVVR
jgi:F-type H+-transporting ATPase subunit delta